MQVGDLVKVQYRFDWIEIGIVTAIMHHNQVKIHWNTGKMNVINTDLYHLEVL